MQSQQRYVSNELTHFAGKDKTPEEQYEILLTILKEGRLKHSPNDPIRSRDNVGISLTFNYKAKISENEMFNPEVICFCDIPVQDFDIHISKYGSFGLSFAKAFIVDCGGSPVYYVPKKSVMTILDAKYKSDCFDKNSHDLYQYFNDLVCMPPSEIDAKEKEKNRELFGFLGWQIFSYIKFFDHNLSEDHEENYYFEREWRVLGNLKFNIRDVRRIIIPENYAEDFEKIFLITVDN